MEGVATLERKHDPAQFDQESYAKIGRALQNDHQREDCPIGLCGRVGCANFGEHFGGAKYERRAEGGGDHCQDDNQEGDQQKDDDFGGGEQ